MELIRLLKHLHANVQFKFKVDYVTNTTDFIIGVKQGGIIGPLLSIFYLAAVIITWRNIHIRSHKTERCSLQLLLTERMMAATYQMMNLGTAGLCPSLPSTLVRY